MKIIKNNKGASEIVGALMLIAIVVIAASGIAVITADMQKNEAERQSTIESVENENLKIMSITPTINQDENYTFFFYSLDITVMNLNSKNSRVALVTINDKAAANYSSTNEYNQPTNFSYTNRLTIPAGMNKIIHLTFTGNDSNFDPEYNLSISKAVKIAILTDNANTFGKTDNPPNPLFKTAIESEDLGVAERDILVLDASESFDDGSITSYIWTISGLGINESITGKRIRTSLNASGPANITLTVFDDTNMMGISGPLLIPADPSFNPPTSMTTPVTNYSLSLGPSNIPVFLKDAQGNPVANASVSYFQVSGNYTLDKYVAVTDVSGSATTIITSASSGGILRIQNGKISLEVSITP